MKALIASLVTALVLVTAAWAGNVTPGNLAALTHRVSQLQVQERQLNTQLAGDEQTLACLKTQWNATDYAAYSTQEWSGFATKTGNANLFTAPSTADGLTGSVYLLESATMLPRC